MDTLPTEVLRDILSRCFEYVPVLKETCYEWNEILSNMSGNKILSLERMAERGHINLLEYIKKDHFDDERMSSILRYAAKGGHLNIMHLAKNWGATDYDWALAGAAEHGQTEAMHSLKEWGADDYDNALSVAAEFGQISTMQLLKEWGADDYNFALNIAAWAGQIPAMHSLKEWGATNYDNALFYGSHRNDVVELLKNWMIHE